MDAHFKNEERDNSTSATNNDSMLDFRSPMLSPKGKLNKFINYNMHKNLKAAKRLKTIPKQYKGKELKKQLDKTKDIQESTPSIESSFFKLKDDFNGKDSSIDAEVALVCPLCFKIFKDLNSRTLHMKICAYKNNIPTKKLLDAIDLQKRQEDERKSLGLLAAPVVQARKKSALHRTNLGEESDLELAIALSRSLQDAEILNIVYESAGVPERSNEIVSQANKSIHEGQLEKFGFAHSKHPMLIKNKKKKCNTVTILHTRSQEERIRILAKRISEILMADEPLSQNVNEQSEQKYVTGEETIAKILKSHLLQDLFNEEARLWTEAQLSQDHKCLYVTNLSEHITPKEDQEVEKNLEFTNTCNLHNMKLSKYTTEASKNEENVICTQSFVVNDECITCRDRQFTNSVINNWANILNNSSASDIIIFVSSGKHIWAHKLVFYVQCSNILLDVVPNDTSLCTGIKDKICWMDISYHIALAFLEFIYCGVIKKHLHIFEDISCFSFLRNLARKYRVKELFVLLNQKEMKAKEGNATVYSEYNKEMVSKVKDLLDLNSDNVERLKCDNKCNKLDKCGKVIKDDLDKFIIDKSEFTNIELKKNTKPNLFSQEKTNYMDNLSAMKDSNMSPDLFDEVNDTLQSDIESRVKYVDEILSTANENKDDYTILVDSDNHVATEIAMLCNSGSIVSSKSIEKNIKKFSSSTPTSTPTRMDRSWIRKPRSKLSLFIEHFQIENEKSVVDNVSESSVLATTPKLCRNPFNIKQYNIFNEYSICNKNDILGVVQNEKDVSSKFHHVTSSNLPQINTSHFENDANVRDKFKSINNGIQLTKFNVATSAESYNNSNSVSESSNTTQKGLEALYFTSTDSLNGSTKRSKNLHSNTFMRTFSATQCNNDKNNMFLDSDTDENEISIYSKYRRQRKNNSIVKYRNFVQKQILKSNVEQNKVRDEHTETKNTENSFTLQLNMNHVSEFEMIPPEEHDTPVHINDNKHMINNQQTILEYQEMNNSSKLKYSKCENNLEVLRGNSLSRKSDTNKHHFPTSPVLLASNLDSDDNVPNVDDFWENKMKKSTLHFEKSGAGNHDTQKNIYLADVYIANDDNDSRDTSFTKEASKLNKEIISIVETNKNCALCVTDDSPIKLKDSEAHLHTEQNSTKFQGNCTNAKEIKNIVLALCNNSNKTLCMCGRAKYLEQPVSPEIVRNSVTPPPNYSNMLTPELHSELNKYGLKAQKRKRAVRLLTYIYNELHPMICMTSKKIESELAIINSEEDEPPQKKIKSRKNVDLLHNFGCSLPLPQKSPIDMQLLENIIDEEEKLLDKLDSTSITDNIPHTRAMILKFLTDEKELHNKILAYEPLCINSLHSMLKVEGLKCSVNTLMDILDEQCIAFYIQEKSKQR